MVPAYNEAERLRHTLPEMRDRVSALAGGRSVEIVIVDDGSADDTAGVAARILRDFPGAVLPSSSNRGKGHALVRGMLAARGTIRLFSDADLSTPLDEIPRFLAAHDAGAEIVIGSRKAPGARLERRQPFFRESLGRVFTALANLLVMPGISDFTCGFKSFRAEAAERIFSELSVWDWSCDVEMLWLARRHGYRLCQLPVTWKDDPRTKVHLRRDAFRSLTGLLRTVRRKHRSG